MCTSRRSRNALSRRDCRFQENLICENLRVRATFGDGVETGILAAGFGLLILHNIDEAFIHPEDGGKVNLVVVTIVAALALTFLRRLQKPLRASILAVLGLLAIVQGMLGHVANIITGKATAIDYSGVLFVLGGAILLGLGVGVFTKWRTEIAARRL